MPKWIDLVSMYFNTLKHLKASQIFYRIIFELNLRRKIKYSTPPPKLNDSNLWVAYELLPPRIDENRLAKFLNIPAYLNFPEIWSDNTKSKLWLYNLHYFEDLVSFDGSSKTDFHGFMLDAWIEDNPPFDGVGWEPYPTSLRVVNILKAWLGGFRLTKLQAHSAFLQTQFLYQRLELHLLGNHYFVNLKALIFSGVIFARPNWLDFGVKELTKEIDEQVLSDGAHFELSPMYHALILVDVLDLINLSEAFRHKFEQQFVTKLHRTAARMLEFLDVVTLGDGNISFFNDAAFGIAPNPSQIHSYAKALGVQRVGGDSCKFAGSVTGASGYLQLQSGDVKILFDAAEVGPAYIPGHAHADTLSVEVSIGRQRLIVNSGTSTYQDLALRQFQRSTRAHSTVEVNETDSSQVWASFRVGSRSKILKREHKEIGANRVFAEASHSGYSTLLRKCIHNRRIELSPDGFSITDSLRGRYRTGKGRYYFHPGVRIRETSDAIVCFSDDFEVVLDTAGLSYSLIPSKYFPEFGVEENNWCLEIRFDNPTITSRFRIKR